MTYEFICIKCGSRRDVVRAVVDRNELEHCLCGREMMRVEIPSSVENSIGTFIPAYYPAFGKRFESKLELKNHMKRIKSDTGREVFEVGNEKSALRKLAPPVFKPDVQKAVWDLKRMNRG